MHVVKRYNTSKLNMPETRKRFQLKLRTGSAAYQLILMKMRRRRRRGRRRRRRKNRQESVVVLERKVESKWIGNKTLSEKQLRKY